MLRSLRSFKNSDIQAANGAIGSVDNFLFDDAKWSIRYLVVNTDGWLLRKDVLISPLATEQVVASTNSIRLSITKEQVEKSPVGDTCKPVSRQMEMRHHDYYRWPYYWVGSGVWGMSAYPAGMLGRPYPVPAQPREYPEDISEDNGDPHLRSAKAVEGYEVSATDNVFGKVEDFIVDDESWRIRYLVINTANFWLEKTVLVSPEWVSSVSWPDAKISVDLTKEQIKNSPEYDANFPVNHEYEARLYDYYGRPNYWVKDSSPNADIAAQTHLKNVI
jgi:uncharacterized protein YrrD